MKKTARSLSLGISTLAMFSLMFSLTPVSSAQESGDTCAGSRDAQGCSFRAAENARLRLRSLVRELQGELDAVKAAELGKLYLDWSAAIESNCGWESSFYRGAPVAPVMYANCLRALSEQRIERLKLFLCDGRGQSGDCPASQKYD